MHFWWNTLWRKAIDHFRAETWIFSFAWSLLTYLFTYLFSSNIHLQDVSLQLSGLFWALKLELFDNHLQLQKQSGDSEDLHNAPRNSFWSRLGGFLRPIQTVVPVYGLYMDSVWTLANVYGLCVPQNVSLKATFNSTRRHLKALKCCRWPLQASEWLWTWSEQWLQTWSDSIIHGFWYQWRGGIQEWFPANTEGLPVFSTRKLCLYVWTYIWLMKRDRFIYQQ